MNPLLVMGRLARSPEDERTGPDLIVAPLAEWEAMTPERPPRSIWAAVFPGNPLASDDPGQLVPLLHASPEGGRIIAWSGTLAEDLCADDPRNWTGPGWGRLMELCDTLRPHLEDRGQTLLFRTNASHVLSDGPSCRRFLRERPETGQPFGLLLDPVAMLAPGMHASAEDHLARLFADLPREPGVAAVILTNAVRNGSAELDHPVFVRCPVYAGVVPAGLIVRLAREHVPAEKPILIEAHGDVAGQVAALAEADARS